ncbi:DEAD/DEAH box helicase family protein [uncultured Thiodictyon sp.]|uniref:DEAD/DEAH box helicase family protein n=1 Tax=uncultured Thiodictyon sp. TaxID=1846217 RepID=UPI0025D8AE12|nr:DEAD/DEAH box helicase family protein [uncultured Thiodictyon sp.]
MVEDGKKERKEGLIFPRYHQLEAVRQVVAAVADEGVGFNYLAEHSAGSGKSNTIAWLAHRLSSLHNARNERLFDSVVVITDRVVLDRQLQNTIYQFDHRQGVVHKIDENSRQLADALAAGVPIIITTLQKFPFVAKQLAKLSEERGEGGKNWLPTRNYAVIIDEAHSSQSGETATELKGVLGGGDLRRKAQEMAQEEGGVELEPLFRAMAKRGRQPNISFFAFTATPKHKTLAIFGRNGEPFHRYTMRQAIEEDFIEDVLKSYVTYKTYYKLLKAAADDPKVERKPAAKALARFMRLHRAWRVSRRYRPCRGSIARTRSKMTPSFWTLSTIRTRFRRPSVSIARAR